MGNTWNEREDNFEDRPVRTASSAAVRIGVVIAVVMIVGAVLGTLHWGFGVFTSDIKGRGDAEVIKNDAKNRIRAQEGFWDKYQAVVVADQKISAHAEMLKSRPGDLKLETELIGLKQICLSAVGTYNATAQKFSQKDYMDAELPAQIDDTSAPALDCKENNK